MSKKAMYDLRNMLCDELDELARKGELGAGDLEIAHKLTDTIKNIDKIEMMEDDGYSRDGDYSRRYSRDGDWQPGMRGAYDRDKLRARIHRRHGGNAAELHARSAAARLVRRNRRAAVYGGGAYLCLGALPDVSAADARSRHRRKV